jgi:hypothetical protein
MLTRQLAEKILVILDISGSQERSSPSSGVLIKYMCACVCLNVSDTAIRIYSSSSNTSSGFINTIRDYSLTFWFYSTV